MSMCESQRTTLEIWFCSFNPGSRDQLLDHQTHYKVLLPDFSLACDFFFVIIIERKQLYYKQAEIDLCLGSELNSVSQLAYWGTISFYILLFTYEMSKFSLILFLLLNYLIELKII